MYCSFTTVLACQPSRNGQDRPGIDLRMPDASPRFGIGKPMLVVPRFSHIPRRSGAKIVAASGHLKVTTLYKNLFALGLRPRPRWGDWEITALPQTLSWWGVARSPSPRTPPSFGPSGLGSPFALPWKQILNVK